MVSTEQIANARLESWKHKLADFNATPLVLIGVGHEHKSGELVVCVPNNVEDDLLIGALVFAINAIKPGLIPKHESNPVTPAGPRKLEQPKKGTME